MALSADQMLTLVVGKKYGKVEDAWMEAVGDTGTDLLSLVPILKVLVKAGQSDSAELLAWSTVKGARERLDADLCLRLMRDMYVAVPTCGELRNELIAQYQTVHGDHPHIEKLLKTSGLMDGSKSPRLSLRTLDLCLLAKPGSFLLSRRDDTIASVAEVSDEQSTYSVTFNGQRHEYGAAELATEFGPVDPDDFRVLSQHRPERFGELLDKDPTALIVSMLRAQTSRFTADDLRLVLCPRYLAPDKWTKWWTRARAQLKKTHAVRLEGRNPATLVYDPAGWTIEDVSWDRFPKSEIAAEYYDAVEGYFREAKLSNLDPKPEYLSRMAEALRNRMRGVGRHAADGGLGLLLILEGLGRRGAKVEEDAGPSASELIRGAPDAAQYLSHLAEDRLWGDALDAAKIGLPDTWPEVLAALLPRASVAGCQASAVRLHEAGRSELLERCLVQMMEAPSECVEAIAWAWKGSASLESVSLPSRLEMLNKMLGALVDLERGATESAERTRTVKTAVKNALGSSKCAGFRECLEGLEESMASTIRTRVSRLDGLGPSLRDKMIEEIRKQFPGLWVKKEVIPWEDETVIYTAVAGLTKLEHDIDHVVNVEMPANAKAIGDAAAHGDLSENSEYKFALEARDMLRARLASMQNQLAKAQPIEIHDIPTNRVGVGSRVSLHRNGDSASRTMTFLGPWDAAIEDSIFNYQAPISQQFMGKAAGETVRFALGDEAEAEWTIDGIEKGLT